MDTIKDNWNLICENLKKEFNLTDMSYETWIKPLKYYKTENKTVYIIIDSDQDMHKNYITNKFLNCFKVIISETVGGNYDVVFELKNDIKETTYNIEETPSKNNITVNNLNPKYKFEDFVVGSNNKMAFSACLAVAETPGEVYNPLYIYGDPGLGKTHLMHSIGHMILEQNPNKKVLYVTSEEFTNEVIESIRFGDAASMTKLRNKYRTVDVLMVDDIQFIIGKESTQEEFFHTFNALHEAHKQIVISSDKPPKEIQNLDERFKTRFLWGLIVDIKNPDYETRMAILRKNAEKMGIAINDEVIQYIATNVVSNIRELEGSLNKVIANARLSGNTEVTVEIAKEALKDIINPQKNIITPQIIINTVSEIFGVNPSEITSQKRNAEYVLPRQVVMYLCYEKLSMSYMSICTLLNKKDHTTIIHGVKKINNDIATDMDLKNKIDIIKKRLS